MLNGITTRSPAARSRDLGADLLDDAHRLVAEDVALAHERARAPRRGAGRSRRCRSSVIRTIASVGSSIVGSGTVVDPHVALAVPGDCLHGCAPVSQRPGRRSVWRGLAPALPSRATRESHSGADASGRAVTHAAALTAAAGRIGQEASSRPRSCASAPSTGRRPRRARGSPRSAAVSARPRGRIPPGRRRRARGVAERVAERAALPREPQGVAHLPYAAGGRVAQRRRVAARHDVLDIGAVPNPAPSDPWPTAPPRPRPRSAGGSHPTPQRYAEATDHGAAGDETQVFAVPRPASSLPSGLVPLWPGRRGRDARPAPPGRARPARPSRGARSRVSAAPFERTHGPPRVVVTEGDVRRPPRGAPRRSVLPRPWSSGSAITSTAGCAASTAARGPVARPVVHDDDPRPLGDRVRRRAERAQQLVAAGRG